ncbi:hypothetical protein [Pseudomonas sp. B7]|uniref:hypothetical protein n=1 Tax=Pseudomonas sp. B7 TaxID=360962 RepID=UPI00191D81A6|nr:hypothetical protein [Pseudomonas sp. B7]
MTLKRVSREHYITGKAAINFHHPGSITGGWHFLSCFDRKSGVAKVSLAGIHYPETTGYFGDLGITDVTDLLADRGWTAEGRRLFMADHYRAAADMIVRWALSESSRCNVEIAEWFPDGSDRQRLLAFLNAGMPKLRILNKQEKLCTWLRTQPLE